MFTITRRARWGGLLSAAVLASLLTACGGGHQSSVPSVGASAGSSAPTGGQRGVRSFTQICAPPLHLKASCTAVKPLTGIPRHAVGAARRVTSSIGDPAGGWYPSDLASAYGLPSLDPTIGSGVTVAIVDAFDAPTAESDLAAYRSYFGLPPCTTANGCFKKLNQRGVQGSYPPSGQAYGWTVEIALDLDAVSAVCPNCKITLVESDDDYLNNLAVAVDTAATVAKVISNSYVLPEADPNPSPGDPTISSFEPHYNHPGVVITAGTGDWGYQSGSNAPFPAGSPHVVAVGGTSLTYTGSGSRPWSESAWVGAGSGCSTIFAKPTWQTDSGCPKRTTGDVSASADGLAIYDTLDYGGWAAIGGTSEATPIIAAMYGLGGNPSSVNAASTIYSHAANLNDVTSGSTATCSPAYLCTAGPGYDGPTGVGSPNGTLAFGGTTPQWRQLPGGAVDLAASDTALFVVGTDGKPYQNLEGTWTQTPISGVNATHIAMSPIGQAWATSTDNRMWRLDSTGWTPTMCCGTDIGVGRNNDLWFVQPGGLLYSTNNGTQFGTHSRVSAGPDGKAWSVDTSGNIWQWLDGVSWGCCFADVGVGANNQVYATGSDHNSVWKLDPVYYTWSKVRTGSAASITVTPTRGIPYITDTSGNIFVYD